MIGETAPDPVADPVSDTAPGLKPAPALATEAGQVAPPAPESAVAADETRPKEVGGRDGPDPVRYGDWEKNGRCIDF